ncbi:hypothetical protein [Streptomyces sp. NPDC050416]|uniref:hypothetical protein n=1 Tax=Streptomyces sp. NPDC050416 TaxID=3365611 RepID=UPI0037B5431E
MERKTRTRRPTPAERHAARVLGVAEPEEVEEDVTPSAAQHAARLAAPRASAKPKGMQTAEWYDRRALISVRRPGDEEAEEEGEREARPLPQWARRWLYRPDGGDAA